MTYSDDRTSDLRTSALQAELAAAAAQNQRLVATLREARDQIVALKEEVDRLAEPPSGYGVFLERMTTAASTSSRRAARCVSS